MNEWFEDLNDQEEFAISEFDLSSSPNDFNVKTIFDFIESGVIKIPPFQRNFVWDIKRASKLIESLILGIPVPQLFLYEEDRNTFLVIDGQQRLMSIYYFIKMRFPKKEKAHELRKLFNEHGSIPNEYLHNNEYFRDFNLNLPEILPQNKNKFNKLNYETLGEYKTTLDLRTIRNIIIKEREKDSEKNAIFEIFNRLNSGGINLKPQEIRMALFNSSFVDMLQELNTNDKWRLLLNQSTPDINSKDVEILLRGFAMLVQEEYSQPMGKFLNNFALKAKSFSTNQNTYLKDLFISFLTACEDDSMFMSSNGRFSISLFEAIFVVVCEPYFHKQTLIMDKIIDSNSIYKLKSDENFVLYTTKDTASKKSVDERLRLTKEIIVVE